MSLVVLLAALLSAGLAYSAVSGSAAHGSAGKRKPLTGKAVFAKGGCGACHTLAAAKAKGTVGPSFDGSKTSVARIIATVTKGNPRKGMPSFKGKFTKAEIKALAQYIVKVRKKTAPKPQPQPPAVSGKAAWDKGGCGACHTMAAAGSTGTVGPNLDAVKPSLQFVIDTVTYGGEQSMPSLADKLTKAEIKAVAEYVVESTTP